MKIVERGSISIRATVISAIVIIGSLLILASPLFAVVPFNVGDVFAGVGRGKFNHFSPTGVLLETLDDGQVVGSGEDATTGMCFDPAGNMYGTNLDKNTMSKFSNNGTLLAATFGTFNSNPESCLITNGGNTMYVSEVLGSGNILKLGLPSGTQQAAYGTARSDWIDLASDGCTMFFTDEGPSIHRWNVCTNTGLPNFTNIGPAFYALRILPNGDVLAAGGASVRRFNSAGTLIADYTASGETFFFALNLDPDGTHFWSGGISSGQIYKFNLTPVGPPVLTFSSQIATAGGTILAGLAVFGENIVSNPTPTPTPTGFPTAVPTPTQAPTFPPTTFPPPVIPTLSIGMTALLGLALALAALLLIRRR